jgi:hypothetical protein
MNRSVRHVYGPEPGALLRTGRPDAGVCENDERRSRVWVEAAGRAKTKQQSFPGEGLENTGSSKRLGLVHSVHHAALGGVFMVQGPARGCLAGLISMKFGGGIIGTIVVFIIAFWLLGQMNC